MSGWLLEDAESDCIFHTLFPLLHETTYAAGRIKLFTEASHVSTHALFQLVVFCKTVSSGVHPSGAQK
jgi:hypothetical protein